MVFSKRLLYLLAAAAGASPVLVTTAFSLTPPLSKTTTTTTTTTQPHGILTTATRTRCHGHKDGANQYLAPNKRNNHNNNNNKDWLVVQGRRAVASALVGVTLWSAAVPTIPLPPFLPFSQAPQELSVVANAKEMASGSGSRVNKDPDSLLRYGLPIKNKEVRKLQVTLETIRYDIGSKRKAAALDGAKKSLTLLRQDKDKYLASCRDAKLCDELITKMVDDLDPLMAAIRDSQDSFQGSEQERAALDRAYASQGKIVDNLSLLQEQMVPAGYKVPVPEEYSDALPQLQGRATVKMRLKKEKAGDTFDVSGQSYPEARMTMVIDGYTAPITAGNFVELVSKGFYNNMAIQRSDGFVVQTGDPPGEAAGYVAKGSKAVGNGKYGERLIPLEIFVQGDAAPVYESTIEDQGRGGQATVLPFSSYGAMGWAREEYDPNSGSSQFFWLLFDSDLTPAGKNVLDGRYPCFGYVTEGADFLMDIKEGDVIVSAEVTSGMENLILTR